MEGEEEMEERRDIISVHSQLPFDYCSSVLREALSESEFDVVSELAVHREVQRKLGLPVFKYTVFTVWDPLLTYETLAADRESPYVTLFNIAVYEDGAGSTLLAPKPSGLGFGAGRVGTTLIARSPEEKAMKILARVAGIGISIHDRRENSGIPGKVHHRLQNALRFVTGDMR